MTGLLTMMWFQVQNSNLRNIIIVEVWTECIYANETQGKVGASVILMH